MMISCEKEPSEPSLYNIANEKTSFGDVNNLLISYSRNTNWCGYSFKLLIEQNGHLFFTTSDKNSNGKKSSMILLSEKELTLIQEKVQNVLLLNIEDDYGFDVNQPIDLPVTQLKYKLGNLSDSTSFYYPYENELPKELNELLLAMNQLIDKYCR